MSLMKRHLEELSVKMGYGGAITDEFLLELNEDPNCLFIPTEEQATEDEKCADRAADEFELFFSPKFDEYWQNVIGAEKYESGSLTGGLW